MNQKLKTNKMNICRILCNGYSIKTVILAVMTEKQHVITQLLQD